MTQARERAIVYGATLDGYDVLMNNIRIPQLRRGDWLQFPSHGAYSTAMATQFNGMAVADTDVLYVVSQNPQDLDQALGVTLHEESARGRDSPRQPSAGKPHAGAFDDGTATEQQLVLIGQRALHS